jgi:tetratricopeptide (TPR) repeat protein/DNA-binding CsgD family transcriptional regulator
MNKIYFTLLIYGLSLSVLFAQQVKIDSLNRLLKSKLPDTTRIYVLSELAVSYLLVNHNKARFYIKEAEKLSQKVQNQPAEIKIFIDQALIEEAHNNIHTAKFYLNKANEIATNGNYKALRIEALIHLGNLERDLHNLESGIQHYLQALQIAESSPITYQIGRLYHGLGDLYAVQKKYTKALEMLFKALRIYDKTQPTTKAGLLSDIGNAYFWQGKYDEAFKYYNIAYQLSIQLENLMGIAYTSTNLALVHQVQKSYRKALDLHEISLKNYEKIGNMHGILNCKNNLAKVYFELEDYDKSLELAQFALIESKKNNILTLYQEAAGILQRVYEKKRNFEESLKYQKLAQILKDSIQSMEQKRSIQEIETIYETKQKEKENQILKQQNQTQTNLRNVALIAFSLVLILAVVLYRQNTLRKQLIRHQNILMEEQKKKTIIEQELLHIQQEKLEQNLAHKERELATTAMFVFQKNEMLNDLKQQLQKLIRHNDEGNPQSSKSIQHIVKEVEANLKLDQDWDTFKLHFENVHPAFFSGLQTTYHNLTTSELRYCAYLQINLTNKEIAQLLNITEQGVKMIGNRLKKKMELSAEENLRNFLQKFV